MRTLRPEARSGTSGEIQGGLRWRRGARQGAEGRGLPPDSGGGQGGGPRAQVWAEAAGPRQAPSSCGCSGWRSDSRGPEHPSAPGAPAVPLPGVAREGWAPPLLRPTWVSPGPPRDTLRRAPNAIVRRSSDLSCCCLVTGQLWAGLPVGMRKPDDGARQVGHSRSAEETDTSPHLMQPGAVGAAEKAAGSAAHTSRPRRPKQCQGHGERLGGRQGLPG